MSGRTSLPTAVAVALALTLVSCGTPRALRQNVAAARGTSRLPAIVAGTTIETALDAGQVSQVRIDSVRGVGDRRVVIGHALETAGVATGTLFDDELVLSVRRPFLGDLEIVMRDGQPTEVTQAPANAPIFCQTISRQEATVGVTSSAGSPVVDLLIIYTAAAQRAEAKCAVCSEKAMAKARKNLTQRLENQINELNESILPCSQVPLRLHLVGQLLTDQVESGNIENDLATWQNGSTGPGAVLSKLRLDTGADIVTVIEQKTSGVNDGYSAVANENDSTYAANAVSVVARVATVAGLTLAHELGHNLGGGHEATTEPGAYQYSHGHIVSTAHGDYSTLMTTLGNGHRLHLFSNPNLELAPNKPLGTAMADNARTFREMGTFLENLRGAKHQHQFSAPTCAVPLNVWLTPFVSMPPPPR